MSNTSSSFLSLYNSLPNELKLKVLGYALEQRKPVQQQDVTCDIQTIIPVDKEAVLDFFAGRRNPLLSPRFEDHELAKEAFYRYNTILVAPKRLPNDTGFVIPPQRYRHLIRTLKIYVPAILTRAREGLSTFPLKMFPNVSTVIVSFDFQLSQSKVVKECSGPHGRSDGGGGNEGIHHECHCAIARRAAAWMFYRIQTLPTVQFDVRKLVVEFVRPHLLLTDTQEYMQLACYEHAHQKVFEHLGILPTQAKVDEWWIRRWPDMGCMPTPSLVTWRFQERCDSA